MNIRLETAIETWPMKAPFRITGHTFTDADILVVSLSDGANTGRGEAAGVYYRGETPPGILAEIEAARGAIEAGPTRQALRDILSPGGARNAVDCALWALEAARAGRPVWQLAGLPTPRPLLTTCTVGAAEPSAMAERAREYVEARAIKMKLLGDGRDGARVAAVRAAKPDVWLAVDANQGFTRETLEALKPELIEARVALIEQPFAIGEDAMLDGARGPIPVAADESAQSLADIAGLVGRYDVVNIKLDKCGGLTEGLMMAAEARRVGLKVMVGCMSGTSLAMAPGFVLGQLCDVVDLDAPMFLAADRAPSVRYQDGHIHCDETVWG
ncbi:MAG: dipeptide epimerase [Caulobacteraceae bacterium]